LEKLISCAERNQTIPLKTNIIVIMQIRMAKTFEKPSLSRLRQKGSNKNENKAENRIGTNTALKVCRNQMVKANPISKKM
jgi:hypothetical protein